MLIGGRNPMLCPIWAAGQWGVFANKHSPFCSLRGQASIRGTENPWWEWRYDTSVYPTNADVPAGLYHPIKCQAEEALRSRAQPAVAGTDTLTAGTICDTCFVRSSECTSPSDNNAANISVTTGRFKRGDRVVVEGHAGLGTVRFVDKHHKGGQKRIGVELDTAPEGAAYSDAVDCGKYFECTPKHGVLVQPKKVTLALCVVTTTPVSCFKMKADLYNTSRSMDKTNYSMAAADNHGGFTDSTGSLSPASTIMFVSRRPLGIKLISAGFHVYVRTAKAGGNAAAEFGRHHVTVETGLRFMNINNKDVTGSIEDVRSALWAAGRTGIVKIIFAKDRHGYETAVKTAVCDADRLAGALLGPCTAGIPCQTCHPDWPCTEATAEPSPVARVDRWTF